MVPSLVWHLGNSTGSIFTSMEIFCKVALLLALTIIPLHILMLGQRTWPDMLVILEMFRLMNKEMANTIF